MPDEAREAIDSDVGFSIFKIMDMRAYRDAKNAYDRETDIKKRPTGGVFDLIQEIKFEFAKQKIEDAKA